MQNNHTFTAGDGERIAVTTYGQMDSRRQRCIIYVHGFKGFKDWGFVPYIGEFLAERDFFVVAFNFSHNGIGDDPLEFTELDKFERNTLSREVRELSELIDAARDGAFGKTDSMPIGLLGHSRGGGIALLTGPRKPEVSAAAVWSSVATFNRYSDEVREQWRRDGYMDVVNQRTGQVMKLGIDLLNDFEKHKDNLINIEKAVKSFGRPLLIIHGDNDESVPVDEAHRIFGWADSGKTSLKIVSDTGHTFGAVHPFEGSNDKLEVTLTATADFFEAHL